MSDNIDKIATACEIDLERALSAVIDDAAAAFEFDTVAAILWHADDDGASDHERDQLAGVLGTDDFDQGPLAAAFNQSAIGANLASFFAAVAALAAAGVRHVLNTNSADASTARENAGRSFRAAFLSESTIAMRESAERMLHAIGSADTRAAQLRRVIGLSSAQARSLDAIRQALHTFAADPHHTDPGTLLSFTRGHLSAAQHRMLAKALRDGIDATGAERLLERHANALRAVRVKAAAGNAAHGIAEAAKLTGWQIAQRFGALSPDQRRYWRTAGDERVRHAHAQVPSMNSAGVPLNQPFATPLGPCFTSPLEHGCRCKATLRRAA